jgi:hypothetical protein
MCCRWRTGNGPLLFCPSWRRTGRRLDVGMAAMASSMGLPSAGVRRGGPGGARGSMGTLPCGDAVFGLQRGGDGGTRRSRCGGRQCREYRASALAARILRLRRHRQLLAAAAARILHGGRRGLRQGRSEPRQVMGRAFQLRSMSKLETSRLNVRDVKVSGRVDRFGLEKE